MADFNIPKVFKEATDGIRTMEAEVKDAMIEDSKMGGEQLHIILTPLNQPKWKDQHEWFGLSETENSAMTALILKLREIGVSAPAGAGIVEILKKMGKAVWTTEEKVGKKEGTTWMPQELLK
jgi:hypothetical protein